MFKLWKIGWNRIEKFGMGKYKIGLRTNMKNSSKVIRIANACFPFLKFCPLTSLSYSLRLQWLQRRSRNQTSFFVGVSAASDRISKKENMHLLSVFPCLSFSYLFSSLFCIFPSQIFQFYSNQFSTTSPYFGFQKTTLSYFLFCASVNLRD